MNNLFRSIGGFYLVVLSQVFGWLVAIGLLTAGTTILSSGFGGETGLNDGLLIGSWVAILVGGPVALAGTAVCLMRYLKKDEWPSFERTGRIVVTGAWLAMALAVGAATGSTVSGLPWYGMIGLGIWTVAPWLFRLAPHGTP